MCNDKDCMVTTSDGKPNENIGLWHRHHNDDCKKNHKFCIAERMQDMIPVKETLPMPLPFPDKVKGSDPNEINHYEVSLKQVLNMFLERFC